MKLYSKSDKAMEAENHFKNRACPKNRTSIKISRTWMTIAVMMSLVISAVAQSAYIRNDELPGFYEISLLNVFDNSYRLYEDALSQHSYDLGINFLGVTSKIANPSVLAPDGTYKHLYRYRLCQSGYGPAKTSIYARCRYVFCGRIV